MGSLSGPVLRRMAEVGRTLEIRGGEFLLRSGELGEELYLVLSGRLEVEREGELLAEIGAGDLLGEIALLCQVPRTASVRAVRDSTILELSRSVAKESLSTMPEALFELFELIGKRLLQLKTMKASTPRVIAITPTDSGNTVTSVAVDAYIQEARSQGRVIVVEDAQSTDRLRLHELEADFDHVFLVTDGKPSEWTRWCWRHADRIVVLCSASESTPSPVERALYDDRDSRIHARILLGILHHKLPRGMRSFLSERRPHMHFNLIGPECIARLVRCTLGKGVGLVLSGGAARGFAHVGVLRALLEKNIPVDWVGGTSVGSAAAAGFAQGNGLEEVDEAAHTIGCRAVVDLTLPFVGLAAGRQLKKRLLRLTDGRDIEDLVLPFFAMVTDLVGGKGMALCRGPVWRAVRASMSIPGVYSPVRIDDAVCVDGGLVANFPVGEMQRIPEIGVVIGVSVGGGAQINAFGVPVDGVFSGWKRLVRKVRGPSIVSVLFSSAQLTDQGDAEPDLLICPEVSGTGIFEFTAGERLIDAGYRAALPAFEEAGDGFWKR